MSGLRILSVGPMATIQDAGRRGHRRFGIPESGPMDWPAHRLANLLTGAPGDAAAIEVSLGGLVAEILEPGLNIAVAGGRFNLRRDDEVLPAAGRFWFAGGQVLRATAGEVGAWCYLALDGGVDAPLDLGSRATHIASGMGGLDGRMLRAGDLVRAALPAPRKQCLDLSGAQLLGGSAGSIDVVLGPQDDRFDARSVLDLLEKPFQVTPAADRLGYVLNGPTLKHSSCIDIVSDGIVSGAIQVPGSGDPIVLMADSQPTGGYPKIAVVTKSSLPVLAQKRPGEDLRFLSISRADAVANLAALRRRIEDAVASAKPWTGGLDLDALASANLIDGVVDGADPSVGE